MRRISLRYCLLVALAASVLVLPGSEGWAGRLVEGDRLATQHLLLSAVGRYDDAARHIGGARVARGRLGGAYLRRSQWRDAAEIFREADSAGQSSREVLLGLAEALDRMGDARAGVDALRREVRQRPGDGETWSLLVGRAARAGLRPDELSAILAGIPAPVDDAAHGQEVAYLLGASVLGPDSEEGVSALRRAASGTADVSTLARELLEAGTATDEAGGKPTSLAHALLAQGLVGPALAHLERLVGDRPRDAEAWALMGYALSRSGQTEEAEMALRRSVELAPDDPLGQFLLGSFLRRQGDGEGSVRLLLDAARRVAPNPAIYAELANTLVDLGDYGSAEWAVRQAVETEPGSAELRLAAAGFYVDRQFKAEGALDDAREAVRLLGRSAESLGTLGWALHLVGRSEEALDTLIEAVEKDPESPLLRYRLGSVLQGLEQPERAREQYLMVRELDGQGDHWRRAKVALEEL